MKNRPTTAKIKVSTAYNPFLCNDFEYSTLANLSSLKHNALVKRPKLVGYNCEAPAQTREFGSVEWIVIFHFSSLTGPSNTVQKSPLSLSMTFLFLAKMTLRTSTHIQNNEYIIPPEHITITQSGSLNASS